MYLCEDDRHHLAFAKIWRDHVKEIGFRDDTERRDAFEQLLKYYGSTLTYDQANTLRAKTLRKKVYRNFSQKKNHINSCRNAYGI